MFLCLTLFQLQLAGEGKCPWHNQPRQDLPLSDENQMQLLFSLVFLLYVCRCCLSCLTLFKLLYNVQLSPDAAVWLSCAPCMAVHQLLPGFAGQFDRLSPHPRRGVTVAPRFVGIPATWATFKLIQVDMIRYNLFFGKELFSKFQ